MDCVSDASSLLFLMYLFRCSSFMSCCCLQDMRLSKLHEGCTLQSCDSVYLLDICRRFVRTYCPLLKADDWQSKWEELGASETSKLVGCDIPKDGVLCSVYNSMLNFVAVLYCFCILHTVYYILCTLYCILHTFWHVAGQPILLTSFVSLFGRTLLEFVAFQWTYN